MGDNQKKIASENMSMRFSKGWGIILYQALMFFFLIGFSIDGLNIVAPAFAAETGIEYASVLSTATIAGMIGVIAYIFIARINVRVGARALSGVCLIGAGASYIFLGQASTLTTYCVALTLVTCFINGAAYIAGNSLIAQWFPKKKGLANGFTTMGHNCGSAFYVPLISFMIAAFGYAKGMSYVAVGAVALGVIGLVFVRNTPQECGMYPDNVTKEVYEREYFQSSGDENGGWTVGKLLKTRELWLCALIIGINQLVTTGVMSQLVVRNTGIGFSQEKAVGLMTVCALIGVAGSYLFGAIDQKFGVKKAIILFLVWYCVALAVNCTDTVMGVYISVAMIGIAVGAAANFIVSLPASVFGRHGFNMVNAVFFPLMQIVLMTNYVVNAFALKATGSLRGAYVVYIGLLLVNIVLTAIIHPTRYNRDVAVEDSILKQ
ncbi:MAG: MFS transporter [Clostridia bacterium]|nr:MFS transporter [Clostridia bacterium]